ncbi:MAG TPA: hypothetical protein VFJ17_11570 [Mycobacteriales bacterium]|nr:hypothetical protein [Mycobacteriales bacterium]
MSAAAVDWTRISNPAGPDRGAFDFFNATASPTHPITVAGTASPTVAQVNIYCFFDQDRRTSSATPLNGSTPVDVVNGAFSVSGVASPTGAEPCVLRAVPTSYTGLDGSAGNSGYVADFAGPTFYAGFFIRTVKPSTTLLIDWVASANQPNMHDSFGAVESGGVGSLDPSSNETDDVYNGLFDGDLLLTTTNVAGTHASVQIDGKNAYPPGSLYTVSSLSNTAITLSVKRVTGGELSITEREPLRFCSSGSPCTPTATGVDFVRTIRTSKGGALATIHDKFVDIDHAAHTVSAEYYSYISGQGTQGGVRLPGQSSFHFVTAGSTVSTPVGPHTIYMTSDLYAADSDLQRTDGGITYSAHAAVFFAHTNDFVMRYSRTVPKNGFAAFSWAAEGGQTASAVATLAGPAQKSLMPHLTLTAPAKTTADNTPTVRGRVTNATNGYPAKVTITIGSTSKTVRVNQSTGRFAATFSLANGKHTAKAHAKDPGGIALTAARTFRCT